MIYFFRVLLIRIAKILPFIICGIVAISYIESIMSLCFNLYAYFGECYVPYKPISWAISNVFEYEWTTIIVLSVLSIAVETCIWNKLSIVYLGANLCEKSYFNFELDIWQIYVISILNLIISAYFTYKGIKILLTHK
jgi:hypothetical protein